MPTREPLQESDSEQPSVNRVKRRIIFGRITVFAGTLLLAVALAPSAKRYIEARRCGGHLAAIYHAARVWADAHNNRLPSGFVIMTNELVTPRLLLCPGDQSREEADNWQAFSSANSSYNIWDGASGAKDLPIEIQQNTPYLQCKFHGFNYANALGKVSVGSRPNPSPISFLAGLAIIAFFGGWFWHRRKPVRGQFPDDTTAGDLLPRLELVRQHHIAARGMAPSARYRRNLLAAARHALRALAFFANRKGYQKPHP
jgi:hypothetical protein